MTKYEIRFEPECGFERAVKFFPNTQGSKILIEVGDGRTTWCGLFPCGKSPGRRDVVCLDETVFLLVDGAGYFGPLSGSASWSKMEFEPIQSLVGFEDLGIVLCVGFWDLVCYNQLGERIWDQTRIAVDGMEVQKIDDEQILVSVPLGDESNRTVVINVKTGKAS